MAASLSCSSWRRVVGAGIGVALVATSTLTAHAEGQNKDDDKKQQDRLPKLAPAAIVPACYNSGSGEWRIVHPWTVGKAPAAVCRPLSPWDTINVPLDGWGKSSCDGGGAFECSKSEFFIQIDSRGPQGLMGPVGTRGAPGIQGPAGPQGTVGPAGPAGPQGATGSIGLAGPVGPAGSQGVAGPTGATGLPGATGARGPNGDKGDTGPQGLVGPAGPTGLPGPTGATGAIGPRGPAGDKGDTGLQGFVGPSGPIGPTGPTGPQGPAGDKGDLGAQGLAGPTGTAGSGFAFRGEWDVATAYLENDVVTEDGSSFIARADNLATDPAATQSGAGPWAPMASKGAIGPVGTSGPQGDRGPSGTQGLVGPIGAKGDTGAQGPAGAVGATGPMGASGATGQGAMTVLSTTYLMLATVGAPSDIPGLLIGANVTTSTSAVLISSEGSVQVNSANAGQAVVVDIFLFVDGDISPKQVIQRRVYAVNNVIVPNITNWSFSVALTGLAPGISHTFRVAASLVATNGSVAVVAGLSGVTRGSLTAVVVNK